MKKTVKKPVKRSLPIVSGTKTVEYYSRKQVVNMVAKDLGNSMYVLADKLADEIVKKYSITALKKTGKVSGEIVMTLTVKNR